MAPESSAEFAKAFLKLLEKYGVIELENVTIDMDELAIQSIVQAVTGEQVPLEVPAVLPEAEFHPHIDSYRGRVREVKIGATKSDGGTRSKELTIGGANFPPFYYFEGKNVNRPAVALDIFDTEIPIPQPIKDLYGDALKDPVDWAKKCVKDFGAEMIDLNLTSTDPRGVNATPEEAAKTVEDVLQVVDVPLMVGGCGNAERDPKVLEKVAEVAAGERVLLNNAKLDIDYERVANAAKKYGHPVVTLTFNSITDQMKLNTIIKDLGVENIVQDPLSNPVGMGIEYSVSFMKRMRLAAFLGEEAYQYPIQGVGSNAYGAREAWLEKDEWGPKKYRGPLWEVMGMTALLLSGVDLFLCFHPAAHAVMKDVISELWGEGADQPPKGDWIALQEA